MAKEETKEKTDREKRWEAYVENYKKQNPVKYAQKRATEFVDEFTGATRKKADEFATIPPSFK